MRKLNQTSTCTAYNAVWSQCAGSAFRPNCETTTEKFYLKITHIACMSFCRAPADPGALGVKTPKERQWSTSFPAKLHFIQQTFQNGHLVDRKPTSPDPETALNHRSSLISSIVSGSSLHPGSAEEPARSIVVENTGRRRTCRVQGVRA